MTTYAGIRSSLDSGSKRLSDWLRVSKEGGVYTRPSVTQAPPLIYVDAASSLQWTLLRTYIRWHPILFFNRYSLFTTIFTTFTLNP